MSALEKPDNRWSVQLFGQSTSLFLPQALLSACAVVLSLWAKVPWPAVAALGLVAVELVSVSRRSRTSRWSTAIVWACTPVIMAGLSARADGANIYSGELCCALLGFLNAAAVLLTSHRLEPAVRRWWKLLGMTWAFAAGLICLDRSYVQNFSGAFHLALLINAGLLILCHLLFRMRAWAILTLNTLILILLGLPIADLFIRPAYREDAHSDPRKMLYLYEKAKKDPGGAASWQRAYQLQLGALWRHICIGGFPYSDFWRLKPSSSGSLFGSKISINSKGFRGPEIPEEKDNTYRIVALGESTTFGITLTPEDKPWPEILEQMIRQRWQPQRPVQVINAGVSGYDLRINLGRMATEILPLKPDMIISYHGYNGFYLIQQALPFSYIKSPPAYKQRPLKLLADCEYALKILWFKHRAANVNFNPPAGSRLMETDYARRYLDLAHIAQTNSIRLVLATYSMAVNRQSVREIIEFYRPTFPAVYWEMRANEVHSAIVQQVAQQYPQVCLVDTHPGLDGEHDKFIDLIHFAPEGEQKLAETFFAAIKPILETDLAGTNAAVAETAGR